MVGLAAALLACALAYRGSASPEFWLVVAVSLAGNLVYITHVLAQRATGNRTLNWRELVLANIVPVMALVVMVVLAGEVSGLFHLPLEAIRGMLGGV